MSAPSDDSLLDTVVLEPDAAASPGTLVVSLGDGPRCIDQTRTQFALLRGYRRVRDLLATARQAIQAIQTKDAQQDTRLDAIEARLTRGGL